jgi:hypothetical protein
VKLTRVQSAKYKALGGANWLRKSLDEISVDKIKAIIAKQMDELERQVNS